MPLLILRLWQKFKKKKKFSFFYNQQSLGTSDRTFEKVYGEGGSINLVVLMVSVM